jgi:hypothetical protein
VLFRSSHNTTAENKYRDQANDSATVRYFRQKNGMPDWYKKKYGHMKEEVEQIDEISKTTLGSYVKRASQDAVTKAMKYASKRDESGKESGTLKKISDRESGIRKATDRLTKEEVEAITELSSETLDRYKEKAKKSSDSLTSQGKYRQANDRTMNVMKATGKQIDKTVANIRKSMNNDATPAQRSLQPNNKTMVRESRRLEIVREAMIDAKKKDQKKKIENKVEMNGSDKFQSEPELSSQIIKNNV